MPTTYFIRTPLPLDSAAQLHFADRHREGTGNQLSILNNGAGTECLVKVTSDRVLAEVLPDGFTPTDVIEGVEAARVLLADPAWTATA
jgi:hypothetical protein